MAQNQLAAILRDFAQGASNSAASTVSAPVDGIAWLLRKAGVPIPAEPVGGSDWMARQGLTAQPTNALAGAVGEFAGGVAPMVAAAKAPQIANRLLQMQANAAAPSTLRNASQRGIFMGDLSKTWDKDAAAKALAMEKAGADPRAIWQETGTFKGPDGKWRQEIDDSAAMFNPSTVNGLKRENDILYGTPNFDYGPAVGSVIEHPALKAAYPDGLTKSTFIGNKNTLFGDGVQGAYDEAAGALTVNAPAKAADARSTMLHELQHAVQGREGFARGGNPNMTMPDAPEVASLIKSLEARADAAREVGDRAAYMAATDARAKLLRGDGFGGYRALAGEAEARAVQSRMNMTPAQRRATFPLDSFDVPVNQLIVR